MIWRGKLEVLFRQIQKCSTKREHLLKEPEFVFENLGTPAYKLYQLKLGGSILFLGRYKISVFRLQYSVSFILVEMNEMNQLSSSF